VRKGEAESSAAQDTILSRVLQVAEACVRESKEQSDQPAMGLACNAFVGELPRAWQLLQHGSVQLDGVEGGASPVRGPLSAPMLYHLSSADFDRDMTNPYVQVLTSRKANCKRTPPPPDQMTNGELNGCPVALNPHKNSAWGMLPLVEQHPVYYSNLEEYNDALRQRRSLRYSDASSLRVQEGEY